MACVKVKLSRQDRKTGATQLDTLRRSDLGNKLWEDKICWYKLEKDSKSELDELCFLLAISLFPSPAQKYPGFYLVQTGVL